MKLSKRLQTIVDLIKPKSKVIDIACDHGLLGIYLLKHKDAKRVLLTDISEQALANAKENALKYQVNPLFKVTDGLNNIEYQNYDTIVIAGLGSEQIIKIINNLHLCQQLLLVTHSNPYQLRKHMQEHGYQLMSEHLVIEKNKYYFIMEYQLGKTNYTFDELFLSPFYLNNQDDDYKKYLIYLLKKYQKIHNQIPEKYILKKAYYYYIIAVIKRALK